MQRSLNIEPGVYKHVVGSLHLYDTDRARARQYLGEGWQSSIGMPPMPRGDPWRSITQVLKAERAIRLRGTVDIEALGLPAYWRDLVCLLQIYSCFIRNERAKIPELRKRLSVPIYDAYIDQRVRRSSVH